MVDTAQLRTFLAHWPTTGPLGRIEPLAGSGGFSGSLLWRIQAAAGDYCLRRWPVEHPTPERLRLFHSVLTQVTASGIAFVPAPVWTAAGETFIEADGHFWELTPWMPGKADYQANPSRARLAAAFDSLGRFHTASQQPPLPLGEGWGEGLRSFAPAPAFLERRQLAETLLGGELRQLESAVRYVHLPAIDDRARRVLQLAPIRLAALHADLAGASATALPLQPAIRDIHHEHVLFTNDEVTGIVDFGALRIDTPLTDVARLVGSLAGDDVTARSLALDAYHAQRPLSESDRRLIDLLDASGLVLGALNWIRWLYVERREFGDMGRVVCRLDELIARLEFQAHSGSR
jgi:Ser/Thr protein kinase RdoA (MazF antagonist)